MSRITRTVVKYIILTAVGAVLYFLCRATGQAHGGGEALLLGLPVWWAVVGAVLRPIVKDVRAMIEGADEL